MSSPKPCTVLQPDNEASTIIETRTNNIFFNMVNVIHFQSVMEESRGKRLTCRSFR